MQWLLTLTLSGASWAVGLLNGVPEPCSRLRRGLRVKPLQPLAVGVEVVPFLRLVRLAFIIPIILAVHVVITDGIPSTSASGIDFIRVKITVPIAHVQLSKKVTFNQLPYYSYYRLYVKPINNNSGKIGQSNQNTFGTSFAGRNRRKSLVSKDLRRSGGARLALSPYATRVYVNRVVQIPCHSTRRPKSLPHKGLRLDYHFVRNSVILPQVPS